MKKKLLIEGMSCNHCVMHVKNALLDLEEVTNADVNLDTNSAIIDVSKNVADETLKEAVEEAGDRKSTR